MPLDSVFVLPVVDQYLVYAPLCNLAALVDREAALRIGDALETGSTTGIGGLDEIVHALERQAVAPPQPRRGEVLPEFLGLIPTRGCNLRCAYCDFVAHDATTDVMDRQLVRDVVTWYLERMQGAAMATAEIHFFGGEPFCAPQVIDFAYHFAKLRAAEMGCSVRFEVSTNGVLDRDRCQWVADSLDSIILSMDGPKEIQDRHRFGKNGRGSFATVARNAKVLAAGAAELSLRACVTADTVHDMPDIADWFSQEIHPVNVCFEPVQPSVRSRESGLEPPDPWDFSRAYVRAAQILESYGIVPVYAAANIGTVRGSFCPVGNDVIIAAPDGSLSACYLLAEEWETRGLDLTLGAVHGKDVTVSPDAVARSRALGVWTKPFCESCYCRWHCAGGCHVKYEPPERQGAYPDFCLQTRLIAGRMILKSMGREDLAADLFDSRVFMERLACQTSDRIQDRGALA